MKDPKGARRKYLGYIEMQRMIARYPVECKELVYRKETEEEKRIREERKLIKEMHKQKYQLHV
jgi:hypothetical protein